MRPLLLFIGCVLSFAAVSAASERASSSLIVSAQFSARTSLKISREVLRFDIINPDEAALATVEFSAGARTPEGAQVILSVEPISSIEGPAGAADGESSLSFSGDGNGSPGGALCVRGPVVAGTWIGSGMRTGRLVFALRANAPGAYAVPVRFVLSTP